jgi:O-antigen/teichoic acid export membrane protein
MMLSPTSVGGTQALQRFYWLGIYNIATPLAKLILGILLVTAGFGAGGAFGGLVIGTTLAYGVVYWAIRDYLKKERTKPDTRGITLYVIPVAIATLSFLIITSVDVVMARAFLSPYDAGIYSLASMLGKIVLWIPVSLTSVTFPRFSEGDAKDDDSEMLMRKSILIVFMVLLAIWIGITLFPNEVINIVSTYHYAEATICLPVVIAAFSLLGLASVFMNYGLARSDNVYVGILAVFSGLGVIAILLNHKTPIDFGYDLLFAGAGICISSFSYMELRWYFNRRRRALANGTN